MKRIFTYVIFGLSLAACASGPTGPTITVMPAQGKPFDVFQQDDQACRTFALNNSADTSNTAIKQGATSAAVGAALGAAAGAVIGGGSHAGVHRRGYRAAWRSFGWSRRGQLQGFSIASPIQYCLSTVYVC